MGNTNVNGEHSAPDSGYQRSEAEIEHQRRYEAAEAARTIQIVYLVEERRPDPGPIPRKHAWVMTRQVGEGSVSEGIHHYNPREVTDEIRENVRRDRLAAARLGVGIYFQAPKEALAPAPPLPKVVAPPLEPEPEPAPATETAPT